MSGTLWAQPPDLHIYGFVHNHNDRLNKALITVYSGGEEFYSERTGEDGEFDFHLPYGKDYVIEFTKLQHYPKTINIFSEGVKQRLVSPGMKFGDWQVELYEEVEGVDASILDKAVGKYYFDKYSHYFDWDAEYAESIREELEELRLQIEEQKERRRKERMALGNSSRDAREDAKIAIPGRDFSKENLVTYETKIERAYRDLPKEVEETITKHDGYVVTRRTVFYPKGKIITFRKVIHDWGGIYYFRDGVSITGYVFELETATPSDFLPSVGSGP